MEVEEGVHHGEGEVVGAEAGPAQGNRRAFEEGPTDDDEADVVEGEFFPIGLRGEGVCLFELDVSGDQQVLEAVEEGDEDDIGRVAVGQHMPDTVGEDDHGGDGREGLAETCPPK